MASGHGTIGILTKRRNNIHRSYVFTHMTVAIGATNDVVWTTRGERWRLIRIWPHHVCPYLVVQLSQDKAFTILTLH
jgi:hypothetical protein